MKGAASGSIRHAMHIPRPSDLPSTLSPFRYPGGKSWLRPLVLEWLESLPYRPTVFIEPFAGGASVGLAVAELDRADQVHLIERDADVAAVWEVALSRDCEELCERILDFPMSRESVLAEQLDSRTDLVSVAFRCLVRNRVQRGGILAPRAGLLRRGERGRGVKSRWYPSTLVKRLRRIYSLRQKLRFTRGDAMELFPRLLRGREIALFVDPPYAVNGSGPGLRLYRHTEVDHAKLFACLGDSGCACFATYHASSLVRRLARESGFQVSAKTMQTAHHRTRRELVLRKLPGPTRPRSAPRGAAAA